MNRNNNTTLTRSLFYRMTKGGEYGVTSILRPGRVATVQPGAGSVQGTTGQGARGAAKRGGAGTFHAVVK